MPRPRIIEAMRYLALLLISLIACSSEIARGGEDEETTDEKDGGTKADGNESEDKKYNTGDPCDGMDGDEDGIVDNGSNPCGGSCALEHQLDDACDGQDDDACEEGIWECNGLNAVRCTDVNDDDAESCDGIDNDCNGEIDDGENVCGGVCVLADIFGQECDGDDDDNCEEGEFICDGHNAFVCSDDTGNNTELCNGFDDNCNFLVDDGLECVLGETEDCETLSGCTGKRTCEAPSCIFGFCEPLEETCNGVDDNCDGQIDEGFECARYATEACTTTSGFPDTQFCNARCTWDECGAATVDPCNGLDDDGDGFIDEGPFTWDFSDAAEAWSLNGTTCHGPDCANPGDIDPADGEDESGGQYLVLTPPENFQTGTAWFPDTIVVTDTLFLGELTVRFSQYQGGGTGADALSFALQQISPTAIGTNLGYFGLGNGFAVDFDTYDNGGEGSNSIAVRRTSDGAVYGRQSTVPCLDCSTVHETEIRFDGETVEVFLDGESYLSVAVPDFEPDYYWIGFAGAAGGASNWHIVDNVDITAAGVACIP